MNVNRRTEVFAEGRPGSNPTRVPHLEEDDLRALELAADEFLLRPNPVFAPPPGPVVAVDAPDAGQAQGDAGGDVAGGAGGLMLGTWRPKRRGRSSSRAG